MDWKIEAQLDRTNWTDITSSVREMKFGRGRADDLSVAEAGRLDLVIDNQSSSYTSGNPNLIQWGRTNLVTNPQVRSAANTRFNHIQNSSFEYGTENYSRVTKNNSTWMFFVADSGQWPDDPPVVDTSRPKYLRLTNVGVSHTGLDFKVETINDVAAASSRPQIVVGDYVFTAKMGSSLGGVNAQVRVLAYTRDSSNVLTLRATGNWITVGENSWNQITLAVPIPTLGAGTHEAVIHFHWQNFSGATDSAILLDDMFFAEQSGPVVYEYADGDTPGWTWCTFSNYRQGFSTNQPMYTDPSLTNTDVSVVSSALHPVIVDGNSISVGSQLLRFSSGASFTDKSITAFRGFGISKSQVKRDYTFSFYYYTENFQQRINNTTNRVALQNLPLKLSIEPRYMTEFRTVTGTGFNNQITQSSVRSIQAASLLALDLPIKDLTWQRARYSFTIEDDLVDFVAVILQSSIPNYTVAGTTPFIEVAGFMLEPSAEISDYFDGDYTSPVDCDWRGVANSSISFRKEYQTWDIGLPIRVSLNAGSGYETQFIGETKIIETQYDASAPSVLQLTAYDAINKVENKKLRGFDIGYAQSLYLPQFWWKLDDSLGRRLRCQFAESPAEFRQRFAPDRLNTTADFVIADYVEIDEDLNINPRLEFGQGAFAPGLSNSIKTIHRASKDIAVANLDIGIDNLIQTLDVTGTSLGTFTVSGFFNISNVANGNTFLIRIDTAQTKGSTVIYRPQINVFATISGGIISLTLTSSGVDAALTPVTRSVFLATTLQEDKWFALDVVVGKTVGGVAPVSIYLDGSFFATAPSGYQYNIDRTGIDAVRSYWRLRSVAGTVVSMSDLSIYVENYSFSQQAISSGGFAAVRARNQIEGW